MGQGKAKAKAAAALRKVPERSSGVAATAEKASVGARLAVGVVPFYSDRPGRKFREFSNFYRDAPAFHFELPAFARREGWDQQVVCEFSEKAIMLTKAALMGDKEAFHEIAQAPDPSACKAIGRGVRDFDQDLWDCHVEEVAFEVVRQKFEASKALRHTLLSTGAAVLAEAAPNDCIWGIGVSCQDDRALHPDQWLGQNILGFALMRARSHLRGDDSSLKAAKDALVPFRTLAPPTISETEATGAPEAESEAAWEHAVSTDGPEEAST